MANYKGIPIVMRWVIGVLAAIIIAEALFVIVNGTSKSTSDSPEKTEEQQSMAKLVVNGTQLTVNGEPVSFRGISLGWHNLWPRFYNQKCVKNISEDWGVRLFRAAIGADDIANADNSGCHKGYIFEPDFGLNHLDEAVKGAIESGSYIIIDWHSHKLHPEAAAEFFTQVAARYKGVPNVIYELYNEPVSSAFEKDGTYEDLGDQNAMTAYWKELKAYAESLIKVITNIDDGHPLILMGCPCWDQRIDLPASDPIEGYDNLMYTVHFYAATHKESLIQACDAAIGSGTPVFISECAACESNGDGVIDEDSWKQWNAWASGNGISMVAWSISDKDETCSMLTKDASSEGPWPDEVIKPWGMIVKDWVK